MDLYAELSMQYWFSQIWTAFGPKGRRICEGPL